MITEAGFDNLKDRVKRLEENSPGCLAAFGCACGIVALGILLFLVHYTDGFRKLTPPRKVPDATQGE